MTDNTDVPNPPLPRANVALTTLSSVALADLESRTGLSKTELVNRALQVYAYLGPDPDRPDRAIYVRETTEAEFERLRFL